MGDRGGWVGECMSGKRREGGREGEGGRGGERGREGGRERGRDRGREEHVGSGQRKCRLAHAICNI